MHGIMELKDTFVRELEEYGKKGTVQKADVEYLKTLASATDHLCNIIKADEEQQYSGDYMNGGSYNYAMDSYGNSYARGRGRNARRDSMGRYASERGYSRDEEIMEELREIMERAPEHKKNEIRRRMSEM